MKRPRFSLRRLLAVVSLVAIAFAAVRLFKQSPFALPDSAAQVLVDCGSRRLEHMWIVAVGTLSAVTASSSPEAPGCSGVYLFACSLGQIRGCPEHRWGISLFGYGWPACHYNHR